MGLFFGGVEDLAPEKDAAAHLHPEMGNVPDAAAHVGLIDGHGAAFVEPAEHAPAVVYVALELPLEMCDALLCRIDPDFAGHLSEDLGFQVRRIEFWIGSEGIPLD